MSARPDQNRSLAGRANYQSYSYSPRTYEVRQPEPSLKQPRRKRRGRKLLILVVLVAVIAGVGYAYNSKDKSSVKQVVSTIKAHSFSLKPKPMPSNIVPNYKITAMANTINGIITQNSNIDMSVSLIDLSNNQAENYGDSQAFTAASTTKVITAADFLHQVEAGQESLSETINGSSAEYEIQQMIVVSDDNAWDALNTELGYPQLQAYADSIGVNSFQSIPNTVTSADMALLLQKLYGGQLLNASDTQLLLSYMKQANYREYIVPAVPSGDTIYHKIGLYEDNVHDEAIITNGSKAFVIVIFTNGNGTYNWPGRAQLMQQITKAALTAYF
jgi:beta-lactamase class A